jgi:hypothetical protein
MQKSFLVVIDSEHVRDAQVAIVPEADPVEATDDWVDATGGLVLGTYSAETKLDATIKAASEHRISRQCLIAYLLASINPLHEEVETEVDYIVQEQYPEQYGKDAPMILNQLSSIADDYMKADNSDFNEEVRRILDLWLEKQHAHK